MLLLIVAMTFALGFVDLGWLAVVAAALLPGVLVLLGAFDDGETVWTASLASSVFAGLAVIGMVLGRGFKRLARQL